MASGFQKTGISDLSEVDQKARADTVKAESVTGKGDWKEIQLKAFTNWVNERLRRPLKHSDLQISSLSEDMADGVIFIKLIEKVAKKKLPRFVQKPKLMQHKLENLNAALKFIKDEKVKLVNIGKLHRVEEREERERKFCHSLEE